ncbi:tetratricopeptide repeat protein 7B-like [Dendronephthya gigantea]|uniref:tetratricopeptide repeat protein 7B-like n=1 Tax=Dendronephthya gigantea TaxID=151771 RepID=UPI00106A5E56|nr:tetratricopeptide repeat protein 7B-like [Dendronephthya gigantea]
MAKKLARGAELEIERARNDGRWADIQKLLNDLETNVKSTWSEPYKMLIDCEYKIEIQFNKYKMESTTDPALKTYLLEIKTKLEKLVENENQPITVDVQFLLCKVYFMFKDYDETLKFVALLENDISNFDGSTRRLKMAADMFAMKGISQEELKSSTIQEQDILSSYNHATDAFLSMLVGSDTSDSKNSLTRIQSSQSSFVLSEELYASIGQPLEIAFRRLIVLTVKQGQTDKAIELLRYFLRNVEEKSAQDVRKVLIEQLINILMNGMSERNYMMQTSSPTSPSKTSFTSSSFQSSAQNLDRGLCFVPHNLTEDVILLLLLKEALVLHNATSSIAPENSEARKSTMIEGNHIYNLLTIGLSRYAQFPLLVECLERAMKLAFEEFNLWFQFGLALASARKYSMAVLVLKQCHQLRPDDPMVLLHSAKLCINNLHQFDEGIKMAREIVEMTEKVPLITRGYLALGIGRCCKATTVLTNKEKKDLHMEAVRAFERCLELDPHDKEALFHLALTQSVLRKTTKALRNAYAALKLDCNYLAALQLIVLLLSAKKKYREALDACDTALLEYPDDFLLLIFKVKLEELLLGGDQALVTCKRLLRTWKALYDMDIERVPETTKTGSGLIDKIVSDKRSLKNLQLAELGDEQDETSSIGASVRLESTLSEEAGSTSVCQLSVPAALAIQARIWLTISEVYINLNKESEATACVKEANLLFPHSPDVLFQRGFIFERLENFEQAKKFYENAVAVNPQHTSALQHLGIVYHRENNLIMSEKSLREAINIDPTLHMSWHHLGVVLQEQNQHESASECLLSAVDLEATSPILPFTTLPRLL